jgi:hypothetical protein
MTLRFKIRNKERPLAILKMRTFNAIKLLSFLALAGATKKKETLTIVQKKRKSELLTQLNQRGIRSYPRRKKFKYNQRRGI